MKILVFIEHLGLGGVLRQVSILADSLPRRGYDVAVVALYPIDNNWHSLWKLNADISSVLTQQPTGVVSASIQLTKAALALRHVLQKEKVQVLYSYEGHYARLIAWVATRGMADTKLVWGIRGSGRRNSMHWNNWKIALPSYLCKLVSSSVPLMIANSQAGYTQRKTSGYRCTRQMIIYNGFDVDEFRPDPEARHRVRSEWTIKDERLIGIVGRISASKGHRTFLEAAAFLCKESKDVHFVIVGDGPDKRELELFSHALGLTDRLIWAGPRQDMPAVYNAIDILCSASSGEGFPNVIGEAMACGIPCVATNVGDSANIIGTKGIVVPPGDAHMLASGLETMLLQLDHINPLEIRSRIVRHFSLETMVDATEQALKEICSAN